ncbi:MAG TPA: hypothetical protein VJ721_06975 [Chthoniobacterales bacterium]|nr:hypothetical protein [Chthoniobacterales bacterium]
MTNLCAVLIALASVAMGLQAVDGQQTKLSSKKKIEATSPDGKFGFRYSKKAESDADENNDEAKDADTDTDSESDEETQTYDLIDKKTGKFLMTVVESDPEIGPSARFGIEKVLWKPDSKAFAITAMLWKRGTSVYVFMRDGTTFRQIELPELDVDIPESAKQGKDLQHVVESNSQSAIRWQQDGSLLMKIETTVDGNEGMVTGTRTVVLGFDHSDKAKIKTSTIKFKMEKG